MSLELHRYVVFAPEGNPLGGKRFALLDQPVPPENRPDIARSSGAPITVFVGERSGSSVHVQFFNASGTEKSESDSGALVVAHHVGSGCQVVAPGGSLEVTFEYDLCWTAQGDHHIVPLEMTESVWLEALGLGAHDLEPLHNILAAGHAEKQNVVVPVRFDALDAVKPDFGRVAELNRQTNTNGVILACFDSPRANLDYRFFAPAKGIQEDNAGSNTLASLCGYRAAYTGSGVYDLMAAQGFAMGRLSSLRVRYFVRDSVALSVRVGGHVMRLENTVLDGQLEQIRVRNGVV